MSATPESAWWGGGAAAKKEKEKRDARGRYTVKHNSMEMNRGQRSLVSERTLTVCALDLLSIDSL